MSNQQLQVIEGICTTLSKMDDKIKAALPHGMDVNRFISTAKNGIQTHPQIDKLAAADKRTLYASCLKAASDGLVLDGREAALVVFGGIVTYMPMTQGLVKLARNSGEIANITAEVVYANDEFTFRIGDDFPTHTPDWFGDRGKAVGVWAAVKLTSGEYIVRIIKEAQILKIASKTKNASQYEQKTGLYFEEFWRKTAIKNVLKYAPKSTYLERALSNDNDAQGFDFKDIDDSSEKPTKQGTRAGNIIKSKYQEEAVDAVIVAEEIDTEVPFDSIEEQDNDLI